MSWELSSSGFLMTLSGYVPDLIEEDFEPLMNRAMAKANYSKESIAHWCIHPGGKRILDAIHKSLCFKNGELAESYEVLKEYGNMSSPTVLFILQRLMTMNAPRPCVMLGFGPGLVAEAALVR